jgi:hypothetical protein
MLGMQFIPHEGRSWTIYQSIILGICSIAEGLLVVLTLGYVWPWWEITLMNKFMQKNLAMRIRQREKLTMLVKKHDKIIKDFIND